MHLGARKAAPLDGLGAQGQPVDAKLRDLGLEHGDIQAGVHQGPQQHVAGDPGKAVEVAESHGNGSRVSDISECAQTSTRSPPAAA